ncbi:GPI mannosyltransferase 2-like [Panonychus citri]|uniref:GPI mannosyltransferase 2-like n=1 Tax=Panonychus citri TaxID=50023 RepID=UPI002306F321|nr:GPI mannosyltransferase 2-like [Panonychus citri]
MMDQPSSRVTNFIFGLNYLVNHSDKLQCLKWAFLSRILCLIVSIAAINIIPPHEADAFVLDKFLHNQTTINKIVNHTLVGFARWDSLHFIQIAKRGYGHESQIAFFPFYPGVVRAVKYTLFPWTTVSHDGLLIISGVLVNLILFMISSMLIHHLTILIFRNRSMAMESVFHFCFNPASIFMTSCYSENLFQFFTLSGLTSIEFGRLSLASVFFACASLTRSNGIISLGFVAYWHVSHICILSGRVLRSARLVEQFGIFLSHALMIVIPFIMFQSYSYYFICFEPDLPDRKDFCASMISIPYTFVQKKYWSIGLFKYYRLKQIPNFLIASPMIYICSWIVCKYLQLNGKQFLDIIFNFRSRRRGPTLWNNGHVLPYIVHLAFLTFVSIFYMHVQVITRFVLSSTPIVYWAISSSPNNKKYYFKLYFLSYFFLGTILHSTFYPWT